MKKICLFTTLFICVLCTFAFVGCSMGKTVKSIEFIDNGEEIVIELGKFNYDDYKINVKYSNGKSEEVTLTEEMISTYDKLKFYQVGEQEINVIYKNKKCKISVTVKRSNLDGVVLESKTVVYTGKPFVMEVQGYIPADVTVRYPNGNTFTNAGTYDIKAICYGDNYETKELSATLTIEKAEYDMSGVKFEDATFTYDKSPKTISITGTLPVGVGVEYRIGNVKGNSATNAGRYEVVASFTSANANYGQILEKTAVLTINKAKFADFDITFNDKNVVYSGHSNFVEADLTNVPNGVTTYYTIKKIKNAIGDDVEGVQENGNSAILAGTYSVSLNFLVADTDNYESIAPISAKLIIERAVYVIDNAFMYSQSYKYDGLEKSITLSGENVGSSPVLPFGVEVTYTYRKIKDGSGTEVEDVVVSGNSASQAGTYEISAHLTSDDENYKEISDIVGILEITQAEYEDLTLTVSDLTVVYDGNSHSITVTATNLPTTVTIVYKIRKTKNGNGEDIENPVELDGNSATEVGTYEIIAEFVNTDGNYSEISSISAVLVITEAE